MSGQQQQQQPQQQPHGEHQVQSTLQQLPPQVYHQPLHTSGSSAPGGQPVFDLGKFWMEEMHNVQAFDSDFKNHPLPLARIKKVMKTDQDVKMISAEAPILFAKGCEIFITELTKRAWVHAEENKRRTLQRSDIATAISKTDMCDFLIDIVPREEATRATSHVYDQNTNYAAPNNGTTATATATNPYYQPQYAATSTTTQIDPGNYYPQLSQFTTDQVQQYQMQLQQYQMQQQQQQQQQQHQQQQQQHSNYEDEQQPKTEEVE